MHFTIITPSFNQLVFLKRCVASVRDQRGAISDKQLTSSSGLNANGCQLMAKSSLSVHHHIQDACSTDGTREYLAEYLANSDQLVANSSPPNAERPRSNAYSFSYECAPDNGMYDAINRGVELAIEGTGGKPKAKCQQLTAEGPDSIVAWLNCDEQYLPGTLEFVSEYFDRHPEVDILFGDYLMIDEGGKLLSFRKGCTPRLWYIQTSHLNNLSCTMFFRERVVQSLGGFDAKYKAVADEDFILRALKAGFKARHVRRYFSVFTFTGFNLGGCEIAKEEYAKLKDEVPLPLRLFKAPLNMVRWIEKFFSGTYVQNFPLEYAIYMGEAVRRRFSAKHASWRWPMPNA